MIKILSYYHHELNQTRREKMKNAYLYLFIGTILNFFINFSFISLKFFKVKLSSISKILIIYKIQIIYNNKEFLEGEETVYEKKKLHGCKKWRLIIIHGLSM